MGENIDWKTISLAKKDGSKVDAEDALKGKLVGLYFSAHWCGPCRWFTPILKKFYDAVKDSENFEIVFVSRDRSADEMKAYMEECHGDWLHVPFDDEVLGGKRSAHLTHAVFSMHSNVLEMEPAVLANERHLARGIDDIYGNVQASARLSGPEDLVVRLKAAGNDPVLLREIAAAAIAALLTSQSAEATNDAKRLKKTLNRPSVPNETLVEILLFADRDTLDAMQLVCSFLLEFIRDREAEELPLRPISRLNIGKCSRPGIGAGWLPIVSVVRDSHTGQELVPGSVSKLVPYLRLALCESVYADLRWTGVGRERHEAAYGAFFGDLILPITFVNVLTVRLRKDGAVPALCAFETFKPTSKLVVESSSFYLRDNSFNEAFFLSAVECGARSIEFISGGVIGVTIGFSSFNFLEQLVQIASILDGRERIDFRFSVANRRAIDTAGFEKFQTDECTWLVNDLQNGVMLEVVEAEKSFEIHVFSSA